MRERLGTRTKFLLIRSILVVAGIVALMVAASAVRSPDSVTAVSEWASWSPSSDGEEALKEIAAHVGPSYRGDDGQQLVSVVGTPLQVQGDDARIAIRNADGKGGIQMVDGNSALFALCGLGPNCSIPTGKPSVERMMLLRREGLELALYAFQADDSLDNVVVMMPPRPGSQRVKSESGGVVQVGNQGAAMLITRSQVQGALDRPLSDTLPAEVPTIEGMRSAPETATVKQLTEPSMFMLSIVEGQDGTPYVVLDPFN